ncbi:MAG: CPBP family intramembrane metalloprotease, partial [Sedimentisphaerales bacterium]|nr:CPBP family intramembrane metalloprotease [Sedimentisphaerales bacterium]
MLMIISLAVAAFYPALDLTAGEKERGTFETLLSTPVGKTEIVTGKFLAIFILAMITASLSLGSMALTLIGQLSQFANSAGDQSSPFAALSISPATIAIMLVVLIPLAFFICSVMMSIALFARNIQEAQHYVTPFYLCIVLPAVIAAIPTVEITKFTMLLPIINVALLFKELLIGNFDPETITAVFISISGWALLALTVSVRLFQSEQLILSQEKGLPFTLKRSRLLPAEKPGVGLALGLFAFCLLALFYIGSWFQSRSLISGIIITEWIIVLLPVMLTLWFYKINITKTLSLKAPRWYEPVISMIFILATLVVVMRLGIEQAKYMPMPNMDNNKLLTTMLSDNPSWWQTLQMLFAIAFSAAVCEEILFRGVVLSGLSKPGKNALPAVIITAGLFAIMHLSFYRLMPTFILGLALGYLTSRTGSIFNSMLAHCFNNAIPILIFHKRLPQNLTNWLEQFEGTDPSVIKPMPAWLIIAAVAVIVGIILILEQQKLSPEATLENTPGEN